MLSAGCNTVRIMEQQTVCGGTLEYTLMLRAGVGAARIIDRLFSNASRFVILSGSGNNGGDAPLQNNNKSGILRPLKSRYLDYSINLEICNFFD